LGLISRFINIYEQYAPELDEKSGGLYNLEFYGNCARGETLIDKIKDEFNNQATIKLKYWGFRNVNIKIFANGRLQMTGLRYEDEATVVADLLINILKNIKIHVIKDIKKLPEISNIYDFQLVYDPINKNVTYYRKYYNRFLKDYDFNTDLICEQTETSSFVNLNRKNFVKGVHDIYNITSDPIEEANNTFIKETDWNGDLYIKYTINKLDKLKAYFTNDLEYKLSNSKSLDELKINIEELMAKYTDFKFTPLDKLLSDIGKNIFSTDNQTLIDIKLEICKFNRVYSHFLEKKINRLINIRTIDITICNAVKYYFTSLETETQSQLPTQSHSPIEIPIEIPIEKIDLIIGTITEPHNYFINGTETVLINSDFSINQNINLKKMSKLLKKIGLYNSYEPDEYPGVLTKYYYNPNNITQGICNCEPHCSSKEKHSICTKITISVFRPGSIIITGARNISQLISTYKVILKLLADNINYIKGVEYEDDNKQISILNNEFRKISKKPRLFFIKKTNIINYDKITV
jgi:TATA-box binding protein (TBP) (component of TFIID and TFIIIB)